MKLNPDRAKSPEQLAWENGYGQGFANAKAMCDHKAAQPLTDEQIRREKPVCADWVSFRAGVRCAERIHGVGK